MNKLEVLPPKVRKKPNRKPQKIKKSSVESKEQLDAFEEYVKMGHNRSLSVLAERLEIDLPKLNLWSARHNWVQRALEADLELSDMEVVEDHESRIDAKKKHKKMVDWLIDDCFAWDESGNIVSSTIKSRTVGDLKTLLEQRDRIVYGDDKKKEGGLGIKGIQNAVFIIKK